MKQPITNHYFNYILLIFKNLNYVEMNSFSNHKKPDLILKSALKDVRHFLDTLLNHSNSMSILMLSLNFHVY